MSATQNNKLKGIVGTMGGVIAIVVFILPYLNVVAENKSQQAQINLIQQRQDTDHDMVIRMSADIIYIRQTVQELKERR